MTELDSDQNQIVDPIADLAEVKTLKEWIVKINNLFDIEEVCKNSNITVTDLAKILQTNCNMVSKVINQEFKMNFNDLVNQKCAEAIIEQLHQGAHSCNTLLGISLDCGFNSKTTFNRAFKKYTNTTPKRYSAINQL